MTRRILLRLVRRTGNVVRAMAVRLCVSVASQNDAMEETVVTKNYDIMAF